MKDASHRVERLLAVPLVIALIGQGLIAQYLLAAPGGISESARAILVGELALSAVWLAVLLVQWATAEPAR